MSASMYGVHISPGRSNSRSDNSKHSTKIGVIPSTKIDKPEPKKINIQGPTTAVIDLMPIPIVNNSAPV